MSPVQGDLGDTKIKPSSRKHSPKKSKDVNRKLTLSIRPIRLKRSVYFRVPNDIVDLINLEDDSQVTLTLEEKGDRHLLVYSVLKARPSESDPQLTSRPLPVLPIRKLREAD